MQLEQKLTQRLENLRQKGTAIRRDFSQEDIEWIESKISLLDVPKEAFHTCTQILSMVDLNVVWVHMEECSGCSESLLIGSEFRFERFIVDFMQVKYHDMLLASSGHQTELFLQECTKTPYILVVEGSVSPQEDMFLTIGANATSGIHHCIELAKDAQFVMAVGSCSSFGGIQVAHPNPTNAIPLSKAINKPTINIAGCPPSGSNIYLTFLYLAIFGEFPPLDDLGRPLWSYGKSVHDLCERKGAFGAGDFVQEFGDEGSKLGYCLYKVGCRGPYVYNNCGKMKFNSKTSWPIQAGHGCIGCSEPDFWDAMGNFNRPMNNDIPPLNKIKDFSPKLASFKEIQKLDSLEDFGEFCKKEDLQNSLMISLSFMEDSKLFAFREGSPKQIDNFCIESNIKVLLKTLATKTKIGARLVENYFGAFGSKRDFIEGLDSQSKESKNLCGIFGGLCMLFGEDREYQNSELVSLAENFVHSVASKYTLKFKVDSDGLYNADFSRFLSPFLSYGVGGLDIYGLCYGVLDSYAEAFSVVGSEFDNIILSGDVFDSKPNLFTQKFLRYLYSKNIYISF